MIKGKSEMKSSTLHSYGSEPEICPASYENPGAPLTRRPLAAAGAAAAPRAGQTVRPVPAEPRAGQAVRPVFAELRAGQAVRHLPVLMSTSRPDGPAVRMPFDKHPNTSKYILFTSIYYL